jgi:hypothetical protein
MLAIAAWSMIGAMRAAHRLAAHMRQHHASEYRRIYEERLLQKSFGWMFMRDTAVDFIFKSDESFGDQVVTKLRREARHRFFGFVTSCGGALIWFLVGAAFVARISP